MGDIGEKFKAFGWHTQSVDGHDPGRIKTAIIEAKNYANAPSAIILDTVKGYGCDFAEGIAANHHMNFTQDQINKAIADVEQRLEEARAAAKVN
jgi:transketolase